MFGINTQLNRFRRDASPRPAFQKALWSQLSVACRELYPVSPRRTAFRFATAGICAIVLFFSMGTGVYAYESPDVQPDSPLYAVKSGLENVEGQLATTPDAKARFHAKMMGRRLAEADRAVARAHASRALMSRAADELGLSADELKGELHDPETRDQVLQDLSGLNDRYEQLFSRVPEDGTPRFPRAEELRTRLRMLREQNP